MSTNRSSIDCQREVKSSGRCLPGLLSGSGRIFRGVVNGAGVKYLAMVVSLPILTLPAHSMVVDSGLILTIPAIISSVVAKPKTPSGPGNTRDCSYDQEGGNYFKWCYNRKPDSTLIKGEAYAYYADSGGGHILRHDFIDSNGSYGNYNQFYHKTTHVQTHLQSLEWRVLAYKYDVSGPGWSVFSCYALGTQSPSPPGKVVVLIDQRYTGSKAAVQEWPLVSCDDWPDYDSCDSEIKALGYMDQCQQAALRQQPNAVLRSFPGSCTQVWNHTENGVLQECVSP